MIYGFTLASGTVLKSAESPKAYNLNFDFDFIRMYELVCDN
jgi:hypothetical protein